jgi:hypothetical protein
MSSGQVALIGLVVTCVVYLGIAGIAWQFNNPLGNQLTFWRNFGSAMQFKSLPQYQEKW